MLHLLMKLYGATEDGQEMIETGADLMSRGQLQFWFTIVTDVPDPRPRNLILVHNLIAGTHNVSLVSDPGTHALLFGFNAGNEIAGLIGIGLARMLVLGDVCVEFTLQDHHLSGTRPSARLEGTRTLSWEFCLRPGENGTPRVELPTRVAASPRGAQN